MSKILSLVARLSCLLMVLDLFLQGLYPLQVYLVNLVELLTTLPDRFYKFPYFALPLVHQQLVGVDPPNPLHNRQVRSCSILAEEA